MHYFISRLPPFSRNNGKSVIPAGSMYGPECKTTYPLRVLSIRAMHSRSGLLPAFKRPPGPTPVFDPTLHRTRYLAPLEVTKFRDYLLKFARAVAAGALPDPRTKTLPIPTWKLPLQLRLDHDSFPSTKREFPLAYCERDLMGIAANESVPGPQQSLPAWPSANLCRREISNNPLTTFSPSQWKGYVLVEGDMPEASMAVDAVHDFPGRTTRGGIKFGLT
jgi:hypothetical protein